VITSGLQENGNTMQATASADDIDAWIDTINQLPAYTGSGIQDKVTDLDDELFATDLDFILGS
jgi:hypothetical protein